MSVIRLSFFRRLSLKAPQLPGPRQPPLRLPRRRLRLRARRRQDLRRQEGRELPLCAAGRGAVPGGGGRERGPVARQVQ